MGFFDNYSRKKTERDASYLFQVREYDGELWLTYSDCLVCPCTMLNVAPVEAVKKMREMYIKRKSHEA